MGGVENLNNKGTLKAGLFTQSAERPGFLKRLKAIPQRIKQFLSTIFEDLKRIYKGFTDRFRTLDYDTKMAKRIYGEDFFTELSTKFKKKIRKWSDVTDEQLADYYVIAFQPYYNIVFCYLIKLLSWVL